MAPTAVVLQNINDSLQHLQASVTALSQRLDRIEINTERKLYNQLSGRNTWQWILNEEGQTPPNVMPMTQCEIINLTDEEINPILAHYRLPLNVSSDDKVISLMRHLGKFI
jgi:hypothetical protein